MSIERPCVYVVATPIGHLSDFSLRGIATLRAVDFILSEDTRSSQKLLSTYGIDNTIQTLHDHNENRMSGRIVKRLQEKKQAVALISDAGTPLISDPGFRLVQTAIKANIPVTAVPGPSALIAALSVAGLPTNRFTFEGFLPRRAVARTRLLASLRHDPRTLVFYEAPHRLVEALEAMISAFGEERGAVVARELTKKFESLYRGCLGLLYQQVISDSSAVRGEIVIIVEGTNEEPDATEASRVMGILLEEMDRRSAVRVATALTGLPRNKLYSVAIDDNGVDPDVEI